MRKIILGSTLAAIALLTGCGNNADQSQPIESSASAYATPIAPDPTGTGNVIDVDAAKAYRVALEKSLASQADSGLTEVWQDSDGNLAQVVAFDVANGKAVQHDIVADSAQGLTGDAMMPTVLLDELDALEGNAATDKGSVTSQKAGSFTVLNHVDELKYVSVYTVDAQGRIGTAEVTVDGDLSATAVFTYSLTAEAKAAFAKLK